MESRGAALSAGAPRSAADSRAGVTDLIRFCKSAAKRRGQIKGAIRRGNAGNAAGLAIRRFAGSPRPGALYEANWIREDLRSLCLLLIPAGALLLSSISAAPADLKSHLRGGQQETEK